MFRCVLCALALAVPTAAFFAAPTVATASPTRGPGKDTTVVSGGAAKYYIETLRAKEATRVRVSGDGSSCLELRVYDENGNLVASDTRGDGDDREVEITPKWTGKFKIVVTNCGSRANLYTIVID